VTSYWSAYEPRNQTNGSLSVDIGINNKTLQCGTTRVPYSPPTLALVFWGFHINSKIIVCFGIKISTLQH